MSSHRLPSSKPLCCVHVFFSSSMADWIGCAAVITRVSHQSVWGRTNNPPHAQMMMSLPPNIHKLNIIVTINPQMTMSHQCPFIFTCPFFCTIGPKVLHLRSCREFCPSICRQRSILMSQPAGAGLASERFIGCWTRWGGLLGRT